MRKSIACIFFCLLTVTAGADPSAPAGLSAAEWRHLAQREQAQDFSILSVEAAANALHHASRRVRPSPELLPLLLHLQRSAHQHGGMGLAAVQIGIPLQVVVLRPDQRSDFRHYLNPVRIAASAATLASWENCLSVPWGYRYTERAREIVIRYQDTAGQMQQETLRGEAAVVMQQELDHLHGRLLSDGYAPHWFVPPDAMARFAGPIDQQCQHLPRPDCEALMRTRWQAWGRR